MTIAGEATAQRYLQSNDLEVFYTLDEENKPTIPRVVIVRNNNGIFEVRGVAKEENLDPYIGEVVQKKMHEFPDGKQYEKKAGDMKLLTAIENKVKANKNLSKDDLIFLYEINSKIEGFGYQKDPRIKELRDQRDPKADATVVFECTLEQIAWNQKEINQNTKAYIGPLFKDIFKKLSHLEHIYTSFPEGKIRRETIAIGGKDAKQLEKELIKAGFKISDYAKFMLNSEEFKTQKQTEPADLVRLQVRDLFNDNKNHTTEDIYKKAQDMGLELCPTEVGPHYRLQYKNQPLNEWIRIAMKQIADPVGGPRVFYLGRHAVGVWLDYSWAEPANRWNPGDGFVFRLRK